MGKNKHKKHHRHDEDDDGTEGDNPRPSGLKLILKVGGATSGSSRDKHKKKKKKKEKKKDRDRHDREGTKKDRHHKKHHRHSSDKRDKHAALEMLKGGDTNLQQSHLPMINQQSNDTGELSNAHLRNPITHYSNQGHDVPMPESQDSFSKIPASLQGNATISQMTGMPNASIVNAPPSVVITPKIDTPAIKSEDDISDKKQKTSLLRFLEYLLKVLQKKDSNNFFAMPVNDQFAPGYSQIIKTPMDFSTMRSKLADGMYTTLPLFKRDFELMCTNAMTYNTNDTIYYKSAKKLLCYGRKILSAEKIRPLRGHLPFITAITVDEFGFDITKNYDNDFSGQDDEATEDKEVKRESGESDGSDSDSDDDADVSKVIEDIREVVRRPPGRFEAIPDDLTAQEIAEQAASAARGAAEKLKRRKGPNGSHMGFLRQRPDGTTSLNIITGESGVIPGTEKDRPVLLGSLLGKVKQGTGSIQGFREDRRNVSKPVYPLYYGAYSSHGPTYDSTFSNLTKEETELIYNTYGDNVGVQYAESILNFSRNCDYAMFIVDHLLDILTGNEHRKTSHYIAEQKMLRKEDELLESTYNDLEEVEENDKQIDQISSNEVDFESLKSLNADLGIDMSFLDTMKKEYDNVKESTSLNEESNSKHMPKLDDKTSKELQNTIQKNAQLINELKEVQNERLTSTPPVHFSNMTKPNEREQELASVIRSNLVEMAGKVRPHNIINHHGIRKAMGTSADLPVPAHISNVPSSSENMKSVESNPIVKEQPMEIN